MARKQTKDIRYFVQTANNLLKTEMIQNNRDKREAICSLVETVLLSKNMYHGFNYFEPTKRKTAFNTYEGYLKLAGKETSLIQYYTDNGGLI